MTDSLLQYAVHKHVSYLNMEKVLERMRIHQDLHFIHKDLHHTTASKIRDDVLH